MLCQSLISSSPDLHPDLTRWKGQATSTLDQLQAAVQHLLRRSNLPDLSTFHHGLALSPQTLSTAPRPGSNLHATPTDLPSEHPSLEVRDDSGLVSAPMRNLYNLTETHNLQQPNPAMTRAEESDFIARNVITIDEAEYLFAQYRHRINTLLWAGVLCPYRTLDDARRASSLLVAAVLTVAALHTPGRTGSLHTCYDVFVSLVSTSSLSRAQRLDNIRGLCIGAFYITNLSWKLCGQAVRVATEMNLHQAFLQLVRGQDDLHEYVRLWYVIYVCDHQFSIAYGRPPIMHDDAAVKGIDKFLSMQHATDGDVRLGAQITLFQILAEAYFLYGCDPEMELAGSDFEKLRSFTVAVEQWRLKWQSISKDMPTYGTYPSKGALLYYHFARFQLNSLALRGISIRQSPEDAIPVNMSWDRREAANIAISSAINTLKLIIEENDLYQALIGVPIFTHAMIAMCASSLLKMALAFGTPASGLISAENRVVIPRDLSNHGLSFHTADVLSLVQDFTKVLSDMAENVSHRHLASHVVLGLKELLIRFKPTAHSGTFVYSPSPPRGDTGEAAKVGISLSRPISRNARQRAYQGQQFGELSFSTDRPADDLHRNPQIDVTNGDHDLSNLTGMFDWSFDDGFLWQANPDDWDY